MKRIVSAAFAVSFLLLCGGAPMILLYMKDLPIEAIDGGGCLRIWAGSEGA